MSGTLLGILKGGKAVFDVAKAAKELHAAGGTVPTDQVTYDTLFNLWGSILFEMRDGCERARLMVERAKKNQVLWGTFSFQVVDAVLPEFFRVAPAPLMVQATARVLARLRRIDHFQKRATPTSELDDNYRAGLGFAQDFMNKGGIEEFNEIVELATAMARAHYSKAPADSMTHLLPEPIDPSKPVDDKKL